MNTDDIDIFPIFDQSAPGIWDDFLHIRIAAMRFNYNSDMSENKIADAMVDLRTAWYKKSFNFAFGAYDGADMIGCIHGDCSRGTAYIRHLYVMPEYQRHRIGCRLLSSAENAVSLNNTHTDLVALLHATSFYEKNGYISPEHTNKYIKNIRNRGRNSILPLFCCPPTVVRACSGISHANGIEFDSGIIRQLHRPGFIYRDQSSQITGYCIPQSDKVSAPLILCNAKTASEQANICRRLARQYDAYQSHISTLAQQKGSLLLCR